LKNALFKRKEIWVPTWKGWLLFLTICVLLAIGLLRFTVPFLAPTKPIGAPVLVMEGWMPEAGLLEVIRLTATNHYVLVISAGQEIEKGMDISQYGTFAELGASRLVALGFKGTNLVKIPTPRSRKDRTYHSGLAVRDYLLTNTTYRSIDLISDSVHSRRSWLLYREACAPQIKVGIIAASSAEFEKEAWWKTSNGVRFVLSEIIGYIYARLVFTPD
jgi:hypothetical protein